MEVSFVVIWNEKKPDEQFVFFSDKLHPHRVDLIQLSNFSRQRVSSLGKIVPLDWVSQKECDLNGGWLYSEGDCNALPVFLFNNARYDINLIQSHLLPNPVKKNEIMTRMLSKKPNGLSRSNLVMFNFQIF